MRLTQFSDYALRLLVYVAAHDDRLVTIDEAAGAYRISKNHLMKVANILTRNDFLKAVRGRSGGLKLARRAEEIVLGDVLRVTEPDFAIVECFGDDADRITPSHRLRRVLGGALDAFMAEMDRNTLSDIAVDPALFPLNQPAA
ncbi:RrF2 family transcriptional regulator [Pelagibacterium mangrovi]|uniref:RrF2 family transcriptional regulator n=1 Tax=Pelagibacterium mangrovi TaxID=3119828 RepID=UPI002FCB7672